MVDLHAKGVHWHDESFMPTWISPLTYAAYARSGLTPPVALPTYFPDDIHIKIRKWLNDNYFKLYKGGSQYMGNEFNIMPESKWDTAKCRVCIIRLSDYHNVDGAFGHFLISNFINDFSDDIFVDFAFQPNQADYAKFMEAGLPLVFSNTTHRPLTDFDFVLVSNSFPQERIHWPLMSIKSGIPLYDWERMSEDLPYHLKCPILMYAGLGATYIEALLADNPIHGVGANATASAVIVGEGEVIDLQIFQHYIQTVVNQGRSKKDYLNSMNNSKFSGVYLPSRVLWEYGDKVHIQTNYKGEELARTTWEGGGAIKRVSLIDEENMELHVISGSGSDEYKMMEASNINFVDHVAKGTDLTALGESFKRVAKGDRKRGDIQIAIQKETILTSIDVSGVPDSNQKPKDSSPKMFIPTKQID